MKTKFFLRSLFIAILALGICASADAQLKGILNKAKKAVKNNTETTTTTIPSQTETIKSKTLPSGPSVPKIMSLNPNEYSSAAYFEELLWGMRKTSSSQAKSLADQLSNRAKFDNDMIAKMKSGSEEKDYDALDKFQNELSCWESFYGTMKQIVNLISGAYVHKDENGRYYTDDCPRFVVGMTKYEIPASQEGVKGKATFTRRQGKAFFCEPNLDPFFANSDQLETAKLDLNMMSNFAILIEGYPIEWCRTSNQGVMAEDFDICYVKIKAYVNALNESINGNSVENIEFKPMPKGGKLNASLKAKALAVEKAKDSEIMDCIITSDIWDVKKNAAGIPVRRVVYGYIIYKADHGKMATKVAWAEEYQGGNYGPLHSFGVGTGSFYVK